MLHLQTTVSTLTSLANHLAYLVGVQMPAYSQPHPHTRRSWVFRRRRPWCYLCSCRRRTSILLVSVRVAPVVRVLRCPTLYYLSIARSAVELMRSASPHSSAVVSASTSSTLYLFSFCQWGMTLKPSDMAHFASPTAHVRVHPLVPNTLALTDAHSKAGTKACNRQSLSPPPPSGTARSVKPEGPSGFKPGSAVRALVQTFLRSHSAHPKGTVH